MVKTLELAREGAGLEPTEIIKLNQRLIIDLNFYLFFIWKNQNDLMYL